MWLVGGRYTGPHPPWDLQLTIDDLQFGELGAAEPRGNMFHLASCQMKHHCIAPFGRANCNPARGDGAQATGCFGRALRALTLRAAAVRQANPPPSRRRLSLTRG